MPEKGDSKDTQKNGLIRSLGDALGALFMLLLAIGFIALGVVFISMTFVDIIRDENYLLALTHVMATLGCILAFQILLDKSHEWATTGFLFRKDNSEEEDD